MIAIAATQYWDPEQFRVAYPRAYAVHRLINQEGGDGVKRFIIGRQFFTVLTGFLLAEVFTFYYWKDDGYDPTAFWIMVKSGLVGVLIVLSFGQLNPELLAAEYPLRFMNLRGSYHLLDVYGVRRLWCRTLRMGDVLCLPRCVHQAIRRVYGNC